MRMTTLKEPDVLSVLNEIRAIALNGLHFAKDPYDKQRYERLLDIAASEYENITGYSKDEIKNAFTKEMTGYETPKVAAAAAIFKEDGKVLLVRRADNRRWGLPGGFCEVHETAEQAVVREVFEETGLEVKVEELIDVFSRLAGTYNSVNTTYIILYYCIEVSGELRTSIETREVGFYNYLNISSWHKDYRDRTERAWKFWRQRENKRDNSA
jgi:ADP-ribose pyrophosphatase YjhB (NUDIX family)